MSCFVIVIVCMIFWRLYLFVKLCYEKGLSKIVDYHLRMAS